MEFIRQHKGLLAIAFLLVALVGVSAINSDSSETRASEEKPAAPKEAKEEKSTSEDSEAKKETNETQNKEQGSSTTEERTYNYVAQPGDTYSELARKAVQTYGIINDVKLSLAQIVAAETKLTTQAGTPLLNEAQTVSINQSDVEAAIEYAQNLSSEEKALWATYTPYVDFDTRDNGEA